jgi:hypothetical protein
MDTKRNSDKYRVFQKEIYNLKAYINLFREYCSVMNCYSVAKHTNFTWDS